MSTDRCFCTSVVVGPTRLYMTVDQRLTCPSTVPDYDVSLWFTDDPGPLALRENWISDRLDILLDRVDFCSKF